MDMMKLQIQFGCVVLVALRYSLFAKPQ